MSGLCCRQELVHQGPRLGRHRGEVKGEPAPLRTGLLQHLPEEAPFRFHLWNDGDGDARDVTMTDVVDSSVFDLSSIVVGGCAVVNGDTILWDGLSGACPDLVRLPPNQLGPQKVVSFSVDIRSDLSGTKGTIPP